MRISVPILICGTGICAIMVHFNIIDECRIDALFMRLNLALVVI
jgi:hypothetical protein